MKIHYRTSSLEQLKLESPMNSLNQRKFRYQNGISINSSKYHQLLNINISSSSIFRTGRGVSLSKLQQNTDSITNASIMLDNKQSHSRSTITMQDLPILKKQSFYHHSTIHSLVHFQSSKTSHQNSIYQATTEQVQLRFQLDSLNILKMLQSFRQRVKYFLDEHRDLNTKHKSHHNRINLRTKSDSDYPKIKNVTKINIASNKFNYDHNYDNDLKVDVFIKHETGKETQTKTKFSTIQKGLWKKLHPFLSDNNIDYDSRMKMAVSQFAVMIKNMQTLSFNVKLPVELKNEISDYNDYYQVIKEKQDFETQMSSFIEEIFHQYISNPIEAVSIRRSITPILDEIEQKEEILQVIIKQEEELDPSESSHTHSMFDVTKPPKPTKIQKQKEKKTVTGQRFISNENDLISRQHQVNRTSVLIPQEEEIKIDIQPEENLNLPISDQFIQISESKDEIEKEIVASLKIIPSIIPIPIQKSIQIAPTRKNNIVNIVKLKSIASKVNPTPQPFLIQVPTEPTGIEPRQIEEYIPVIRTQMMGTPPLQETLLLPPQIVIQRSSLQLPFTVIDGQIEPRAMIRPSFASSQFQTITLKPTDIPLKASHNQRLSQMGRGVSKRISQNRMYQVDANDDSVLNDALLTDIHKQVDDMNLVINKLYGRSWVDVLLEAENVYDHNIDEYKLTLFDIATLEIPSFREAEQQQMYQIMVQWQNEVEQVIPILQFEHLEVKKEKIYTRKKIQTSNKIKTSKIIDSSKQIQSSRNHEESNVNDQSIDYTNQFE